MALDEITERVIIEYLGRFEFDAIPWRVPFEAEYLYGQDISTFFKQNYAPFITDKEIEVFKKMEPVDLIAVKDNKIYFFIVRKPENGVVHFTSEEEKQSILFAKKKRAKILLITNEYPEHLFKVYDFSEKSVEGLKIHLNRCNEIDLEKL